MKKKKGKKKIKTWEAIVLMSLPAILIATILVFIQDQITIHSHTFWDFIRFSLTTEVFILFWIISHEKDIID